MYSDLEKKIDDYSAELFADLGLAALPEDSKADLYARFEDRLHRVIMLFLKPILDPTAMSQIKQAVENEDYHALNQVLGKFPQYKSDLEAKIDEEFKKLKLTITEEKKDAGHGTATS